MFIKEKYILIYKTQYKNLKRTTKNTLHQRLHPYSQNQTFLKAHVLAFRYHELLCYSKQAPFYLSFVLKHKPFG